MLRDCTRPRRLLATAIVMIAAPALVVAVELPPEERPSSLGLWFEHQLDSTFSLADVRHEWDESRRVELGLRTGIPTGGRATPFGHASLFYEERSWEDVDGLVDYEAFGIAGGAGAAIRLTRADARLALELVPWGRLGLAGQDVIARGVRDDDRVIDSSFEVGRFDIAGGVDLRLTLARRLIVELGAGGEWWQSANVTVVFTNRGSAVGVSESVDFSGHGVFARLGAAIAF